MKADKNLGLFYVLISAFLFSTKAIAIKLAYISHLSPITVLTLRMSFAAPFYLVILLYNITTRKEVVKVSQADFVFLLFISLLGYYLSSYLDFYGLQYVTAGMERLILFIYPTFTVILSFILLHKKINKTTWWALITCYAGVLLVVANDLVIKYNTKTLTGIICILLCAVTYAIYLVFGEKMLRQMGSVLFTTIVMLISCTAVFIHYMMVENISDIFQFSANTYLLGLYLGIFATVIPTYLATEGLKLVGANHVAITSSIGPIVTMVLAHYILGEVADVWQICGTALVIAGIWVMNKYK
ncbi:MAG: DMT family transporter [Cytophagales bacterium]|nr:DMT family transporter [Cytophagales bacterium]